MGYYENKGGYASWSVKNYSISKEQYKYLIPVMRERLTLGYNKDGKEVYGVLATLFEYKDDILPRLDGLNY